MSSSPVKEYRNPAISSRPNAVANTVSNSRQLIERFTISALLYGGSSHQSEPISFSLYAINIFNLINPITLRLPSSMSLRISRK
nr:MAG TPA: hypothetical protein [Bacteriophage sp.]